MGHRSDPREQMRATRAAAGTAVAAAALFLATVFAVPAIELADRVRLGLAGAGAGVPAAPEEALGRMPAELAVAWREAGGGLGGTFAASRRVQSLMDRFERGLEEASWLRRAFLGPVQGALARWLGAGSEQVYPGRDGWLYFRPDVDYLLGPGFLDPAQLKRRGRGGRSWQAPVEPDPVPAILEFRDWLAARGVGLLLLPVPAKPMIHPEEFAGASSRPGTGSVLQNASWDRFAARLAGEAVELFDPTELLLGIRREGRAAYLRRDTHWLPESVDRVAAALAGRLRGAGVDGPGPDLPYRRAPATVSAAGDTATLLATGDVGLETVEIQQVLLADGAAWERTPGAAVLLLGDSFANIYSLASLGWGGSAGLAEQLAYRLRRPVDSVVENDDGAHATRIALRNRLEENPAALDGVRIVVWQFAMRELASGDWRLLAGTTP